MNRKNLELNRHNKTEIINTISNLYRGASDSTLAKKYADLKETVERLPDTDSDQAKVIDAKIKSKLSEITSTDSSKKQTLDKLLNDLSQEIEQRRALPMVVPRAISRREERKQRKFEKQNKKIEAKLKKEADKFAKDFKSGKVSSEAIEARIAIDEKKQAELMDEENTLVAVCSQLFSKLQREFSIVDDSNLKIKNAKLNSVRTRLKIITDEIQTLEKSRILAGEAEIIDEATGVGMQNVVAGAQTDGDKIVQGKSTIEQTTRAMDDIYNATNAPIGSTTQATVAAAQPQQATFTPQVTVNPYAGMENPYAKMTNPYQQGGGANPTKALEDSFEQVDEQIAALEGAMRQVDIAHKQKSKDLLKIAEELKEMLAERRTASATECIALDGKIDVKQNIYRAIDRGIKRLDQERAKYSNEMAMSMQLRDIRDAEQRRANIAELTGGKYTDYATLSNAINEATKALNEAFQESNDQVALANSTVIETSTYASVGNGYAADVKDEDKYAALEKELGIR